MQWVRNTIAAVIPAAVDASGRPTEDAGSRARQDVSLHSHRAAIVLFCSFTGCGKPLRCGPTLPHTPAAMLDAEHEAALREDRLRTLKRRVEAVASLSFFASFVLDIIIVPGMSERPEAAAAGFCWVVNQIDTLSGPAWSRATEPKMSNERIPNRLRSASWLLKNSMISLRLTAGS